jgi:hypothetical protein
LPDRLDALVAAEERFTDWEERYPSARPTEDEKCWLEVKALAERCVGRSHLYLKFVGD